MKTVNDILNMDGCVVKDDRGVVVATLREVSGALAVDRLPACSLGMYFYILGYLRELGFEVHS